MCKQWHRVFERCIYHTIELGDKVASWASPDSIASNVSLCEDVNTAYWLPDYDPYFFSGDEPSRRSSVEISSDVLDCLSEYLEKAAWVRRLTLMVNAFPTIETKLYLFVIDSCPNVTHVVFRRMLSRDMETLRSILRMKNGLISLEISVEDENEERTRWDLFELLRCCPSLRSVKVCATIGSFYDVEGRPLVVRCCPDLKEVTIYNQPLNAAQFAALCAMCSSTLTKPHVTLAEDVFGTTANIDGVFGALRGWSGSLVHLDIGDGMPRLNHGTAEQLNHVLQDMTRLKVLDCQMHEALTCILNLPCLERLYFYRGSNEPEVEKAFLGKLCDSTKFLFLKHLHMTFVSWSELRTRIRRKCKDRGICISSIWKRVV